MVWSRGRSVALLSLVLAAASVRPALAAPSFCVKDNIGVPGLGNVPEPWWPAATASATATPDDPRWTGSTGHSLASGAATAPAELRASWHDIGGQKYLYLSWQFFVTSSAFSTQHFLFLALKDGTNTRVVRLKFDQTSSTAPIDRCADVSASSCTQGYDVFFDPQPATTTCDSELPAGAQVLRKDGTNMDWVKDTARFWSVSRKKTPDAWALEVRIPVVASTTDFHGGVTATTQIQYAARLQTSGGSYELARWPRDPAKPKMFCATGGAFAQLWMFDPSAMQPLYLEGGGTPVPAEGCSGVVKLDMNKIGVLDAGSIITDLNTTGANTLIARVHNGDTTEVAASSMFARFRLANWGSNDPASFDDVPLSTSAAAEVSNATKIDPGLDGDFTLDWTLGVDQQCQFTFDQYGNPTTQASWLTKCKPCKTSASLPSYDGAMAITGGDGGCHIGKFRHQCVAVELRGGNKDFENRSMFNNLNFSQLSVSDQVALIDTSHLQAAPGQKEWDVFFVVMPRNMPGSAPAKTMAEIVAEAAADILQRELGEHEIPTDTSVYTHGNYNSPVYQRWQNLAWLAGLPQAGGENQEVTMKQLAYTTYQAFDSKTAAQLIPTLEVYAYYKVYDKKSAAPTLLPLTSFSLATYHTGTFNGYAWALDGATHVAGNIYKTVVPVGGKRKLQIEVEAVEGAKPTISQDDAWPCGCCGGSSCPAAYQMGNFGLAALALGWITRRRRSRKPIGRL